MKKIEIRIEPSLYLEACCYIEDQNVIIDSSLMESFSDNEQEFVKEIKLSKDYYLNEFFVHAKDKSFDGILTFMEEMSIEKFHYYYNHEEFPIKYFNQFNRDELLKNRLINLSLLRKVKKYIEVDFLLDDYDKITDEIFNRLKVLTPLGVAQEIMGKKFKRVSDYEAYNFIPLKYCKNPPCRVFNETNLMVMIPMEEYKELLTLEEIGVILKVMSDATRLKIISLLSNSSMYGKEISDELHVKAPTVTHHIEQLNKIDLLYLEKIGQIKYYTLNYRRYEELIKALSRITNLNHSL